VAVHYFKLSADPGHADGQYNSGFCLLSGFAIPRHLTSAMHYFTSAAIKRRRHQYGLTAWMAEHGIGRRVDLTAAVRYYNLSPDGSLDAYTAYGQCCQTGRGLPPDFTLAAELFQKAADLGHPGGSNCLGCCFERGDGVEKDIDRSARYY
jgi:TPR repeat protein